MSQQNGLDPEPAERPTAEPREVEERDQNTPPPQPRERGGRISDAEIRRISVNLHEAGEVAQQSNAQHAAAWHESWRANSNEITNHRGQLDEHDAQLIGHDTQLGGHETRLDGHDSTLGAHETRLDGHDTQITAHGVQLGRDDGQLRNHDERITTLENAPRDGDRLDSVENHLNTVKGNQASLQAKHDSLQAEQGARFDSLEAKHGDHEQQLGEHEEKLKQVRGIAVGIGIAVLVGAAIWGIGKLFGKKKDKGPEDSEGHRHARQWKTADEDVEDENEDQDVYARF
jgi:hypothetical protein